MKTGLLFRAIYNLLQPFELHFEVVGYTRPTGSWMLGMGCTLVMLVIAAWQDWFSIATHYLLHSLRH